MIGGVVVGADVGVVVTTTGVVAGRALDEGSTVGDTIGGVGTIVLSSLGVSATMVVNTADEELARKVVSTNSEVMTSVDASGSPEDRVSVKVARKLLDENSGVCSSSADVSARSGLDVTSTAGLSVVSTIDVVSSMLSSTVVMTSAVDDGAGRRSSLTTGVLKASLESRGVDVVSEATVVISSLMVEAVSSSMTLCSSLVDNVGSTVVIPWTIVLSSLAVVVLTSSTIVVLKSSMESSSSAEVAGVSTDVWRLLTIVVVSMMVSELSLDSVAIIDDGDGVSTSSDVTSMISVLEATGVLDSGVAMLLEADSETSVGVIVLDVSGASVSTGVKRSERSSVKIVSNTSDVSSGWLGVGVSSMSVVKSSSVVGSGVKRNSSVVSNTSVVSRSSVVSATSVLLVSGTTRSVSSAVLVNSMSMTEVGLMGSARLVASSVSAMLARIDVVVSFGVDCTISLLISEVLMGTADVSSSVDSSIDVKSTSKSVVNSSSADVASVVWTLEETNVVSEMIGEIEDSALV